jgi:hypothetical protein
MVGPHAKLAGPSWRAAVKRARLLATLASALVVMAVLALGWLLYAMPEGHWSMWGANVAGARHFGAALGIVGPAVGEESFRRGMRWALAVAWLAYAAALLAAHAVDPPRRDVTVGVAVAATAIAVLFPPSLSCDVYAYVAYARLPVVHGLNPYLHNPLAAGDPTAPFLQWHFPSPYGPLWTAISMALVAPLASVALIWQVLAFKLLAAGALVATVACAGALGERRGGLAAVAIGFNPLFLVEGPGSGHNDLLLVLALVAGALWVARPRVGAALVGVSVGIKLVTVVVVPWLVIARLRARDVRGALLVIAFALAPALLAGALFWPAGLRGLAEHAAAHGIGVLRWLIIAAIFAVTTAWVARGGDWYEAWIATALVLILVGGPWHAWYPWYFTWPLALALPRWHSRRAVAAAIFTLVLALMAMSLYAR